MFSKSNTEIVDELKEIYKRYKKSNEPSHTPSPSREIPSNIIQKIIEAVLMNGHTVIGSANIKRNPSDIDVHVKGLRTNFVEVYANLVKSLSLIDFGALKMESSVEKMNVLYGEKIDCRFIILITLTYDNGEQKEIILDLTDGTFDPPVFITNTVTSKKRIVALEQQSHGNELRLFNYEKFSHQASRNTDKGVYVHEDSSLEKVMDLIRNEKSEVNPHSVLFRHNVIDILDAIRRIKDTNSKMKYKKGIDYKKTIQIIISNENKCEVEWCSCTNGFGFQYQHGFRDRTFVKLQCCGTIVCADLLTNCLQTTHKAPFCPFSTLEGPHFMQFMHQSLLTEKDKGLMDKLNRYWDAIEDERKIIKTRQKEKQKMGIGPHGFECSCSWSDAESEVQSLDSTFDEIVSDEEMPEIVWEDEEKDKGLMDNNQNEKKTRTKSDSVPIKTFTMVPHCQKTSCIDCKIKMHQFQVWASSRITIPMYPRSVFVMPFRAHWDLNI